MVSRFLYGMTVPELSTGDRRWESDHSTMACVVRSALRQGGYSSRGRRKVLGGSGPRGRKVRKNFSL